MPIASSFSSHSPRGGCGRGRRGSRLSRSTFHLFWHSSNISSAIAATRPGRAMPGSQRWRSSFRFLEYRVPACLDQALRMHAIPMKKTDRSAGSPHSRARRCKRCSMRPIRAVCPACGTALCCTSRSPRGLRVSELVGMRVDQFDARPPASIHIMGKGRRERVLAIVEGDNGHPQSLARGSPMQSGYRAVPQQCRSHHDPVGVRVHPRQACRHRDPRADPRSPASG